MHMHYSIKCFAFVPLAVHIASAMFPFPTAAKALANFS